MSDKEKPKVFEYCPNCGERAAELDGVHIRIAHRCPKTGMALSGQATIDEVTFVRGTDR